MRKTATLLALAAALGLGAPASALADIEITQFDGGLLKEGGLEAANEAGSHPHTAFTDFFVSIETIGFGQEVPTEQIKDASAKFPPGLAANLQAVGTCTVDQLAKGYEGGSDCPAESQIGIATVHFVFPFGPQKSAVYKMQPVEGTPSTPIGTPALFGMNINPGVPVLIYAEVRSGEDYGATVISKNAPQTLPVTGVTFTFWGVPADTSHDAERFKPGTGEQGQSSAAELLPFLSQQTSCEGESGVPGAPVRTSLDLTTWEGASASASFLSHEPGEPSNLIGIVACNAVGFAPKIEARPTTNLADAPSGFEFNLHIPQNEDPDGVATAHMRHSTLTLPEGLVANPSGANGLDGCSLAEFGFTGIEGGVIHTTPEAATCPDASKLGTVEVLSPQVIDHPVKGSVHLADPFDNPFNSLIALYITVYDPKTGFVGKFAGKVTMDPVTGRLSTTVQENPQVPFEDLRLRFFGGAGGALRTPATCGTYTTTTSLTPWSAPDSGPPATPSDSWEISQGPGGGPCATSQEALPHAPALEAGAVSPIAGTHSPLVINLRRSDGSQQFRSLSLTPPPGLVAKLAGTPACPEAALAAAAARSGAAEKASPSCPPASDVGLVLAAAGAGPAPLHTTGRAYLAGPYKGAPLSLAVITPAVAGPFDLGTIVVRTAIYVDPKTARITAVSDPLPTILEGIPLDVRTVAVLVDKPQFSLNPTSCEAMTFSGGLLSTLGQLAPLSSPFQVGECGRLGFRPRLRLNLRGGTKRGGHPALTAILTPRPGDANIAGASTTLPKSEFIDQANFRTICTRVQFAADACPAGAVYGKAEARTPLLDEPLTGLVYLRSSDNPLPDLVADLRGPASLPIRVEVVGRTDSIKGRLRNTFDATPDVPVSKFVLRMQGGSKGLFVNSTDICSRDFRATVRFRAHNGRRATIRPRLRARCGKGKGHSEKSHRAGHSAR